MLIALLADGHLLVEGAPGLAKTMAVRALAARMEAGFARVQFTPDLLPADLTGTEVWRPQDGRFEFQAGPIFHPILLADEINRAPAKVQSALLEAMGERQVTVGRHTYPLPSLFLVMATQNPIEQEGTFPLPEAQLDRFLMHVKIGYPEAAAESEILRLARERAREALAPVAEPLPQMPLEDVFAARREVLDLPHGAGAGALSDRTGARLARCRALRRRAGPTHRLGRQPARFDRAGALRACACLAGRARPSSPRRRACGPWPATCCANVCCPATRPRPKAGTAVGWSRP